MSPSTTRDTAVKWTAYALACLLLLFGHELTLAHLRVWGIAPFLPPLLPAVLASMEDRLEGILCSLAVSTAAFVLVDLITAVTLLADGRSELSAIALRAVQELALSLPLLIVCHPVLAFLHRKFTL